MLILIYVTFWVPTNDYQPSPIRYYTPCEQNFAATSCKPSDVYNLHCGPGITEYEEQCDEFCNSLTVSDPRLCQYIDSCGSRRNDDLFTDACKICNFDNSICVCTVDDLNGCDHDRASQFCLGGLSDCSEYCDQYILCSWFDTVQSPMITICKDLDRCSGRSIENTSDNVS